MSNPDYADKEVTVSEQPFFAVNNLTLAYRTETKESLATRTFRRIIRRPRDPQDLIAVNNVSFTIDEPGQALAIVGESGCGKTSLGLAILRQLPNNVAEFSGEILLHGENILDLRYNDFRKRISWKKVAWVPQIPSSTWNPMMKIGEQIEQTLSYHDVKNARQESLRLLKAVGLYPEQADHFPHQLSGGQLQRACIAMALTLRASLIILDEPLSGLDVSLQGEIVNLLNNLKREFNLSYLFITHDIARATELCDLFAVFYGGKIVELGPTEKVLASPRHPYTKALKACIPKIPEEDETHKAVCEREPVPAIPGEPPDLRKTRNVCPCAEREAVRCRSCPGATVPKLREIEPGHFVACHDA